MNEQDVLQLIQSTLAQYNSKSQFSVGPVQYHTHNGIDSPEIPSQTILSGTFLRGQVSVNGGFSDRGIITNGAISTTSIIVATPQSGIATPVYGWLASCYDSYAEVVASSALISPITFNYIIIL